jgi:hypothetical protein
MGDFAVKTHNDKVQYKLLECKRVLAGKFIELPRFQYVVEDHEATG